MTRRRPRRAATLLLAVAVLAGCSASSRDEQPPTASTPAAEPAPESAREPSPGPAPEQAPAPGTVPPPWLGTRVLPEDGRGFGEIRPTPPALRTRRFTLPDTTAPLPGSAYAARIVSPPPAAVLRRSTWRPGCPVSPDGLAWLRVAFRGFDGARHSGELLVAAAAAADLRQVFRDLWRADFPLERVAITPRAALDAPPTGDGNDTAAFVCRPVTGGSSFSRHAAGLAIDLNPFQNPYLSGSGADRVVLPELAPAYLDRSRAAPGMIRRDGPVVRAFERIGWQWGGDYRSLKDWQHFSDDGS